jgi:AraC-like DNA-binding protein
MERYVSFYSLLRSGLSYQLETDGKSCCFKIVPDRPQDIKHVAILDFILVGFHRLFSWVASEMIQLDSVGIGTPPPAYSFEYRDTFFHTPVQFNAPYHSLTFCRSFMDLPIVRTERDLERYLARFNTALFLPMPTTGELSRNLRAYMLREKEETGTIPELSEAAEHFGLHTRGLCRRLKDEGLSFQEIKSRVRRDISVYHLSNTTDSVERIAEHAGFSETSAFIRAFRGWTNMTPLAYRKALSS